MLFEKTPILTRADFFDLSFVKHSRLSVAGRPYHALSFRKSGRVEIIADGEKLLSEAGTITYVPLGIDYDTEIFEGGEMTFVHFVTAEPIGLPAFVTQIKNQNHFKELFREGLAAKKPLLAMSICYRILSELEIEMTPSVLRPPRRMTRAKEYLDLHICDSALKISSLAELAGVSEVYFRSEFKKYYSASPIEYVKNARIEIAKGLLSTGICSVSEVATSAGFDSISYFSQEFRRIVGVPPTLYKKYN